MNMIASSTLLDVNTTDPLVTDFPPLPTAERPVMLVLQPTGDLNCHNSLAFQKALKASLEQVKEAVVVDLLWVNSIDSYGMTAIIQGLRTAIALGKMLSFQASSPALQLALEKEWQRQRQATLGTWDGIFGAQLEAYLDRLRGLQGSDEPQSY